jgi:hypothetical protein
MILKPILKCKFCPLQHAAKLATTLLRLTTPVTTLLIAASSTRAHTHRRHRIHNCDAKAQISIAQSPNRMAGSIPCSDVPHAHS